MEHLVVTDTTMKETIEIDQEITVEINLVEGEIAPIHGLTHVLLADDMISQYY